jgi:hypothetical protein
MREYEVVDTNADNIGGCGFCGYKSGKKKDIVASWIGSRSDTRKA